MKIIPGKYIEESNWQKWVKFKYPHGNKLSLVFLRRLAALARDLNHEMTNVLGYRPIEETQRLYAADVMKYGKPSGKVALPGTSWHENHLAVDLDGSFWQNVSNINWVPKSRLKQSLNVYGLMVPLNKIDSLSVIEWWHLQPVETNGIPGIKRKDFLDPDDEIYGGNNMTLKQFQTAAKTVGLYKSTIDGLNGPKTRAAAEQFLDAALSILDMEDILVENKNLKQRLNDIRVKATL